MKKIKLIVVDDNRSFCIMVRDYIADRKDFEFVGAAPDGLTALDMIRSKKPDIVLLDNIMPLLDGIGVMQHLRNYEKEIRPKVIAVTASPSSFFISQMHSLGADYITSKNTDIAVMIERCKMLVKSTYKEPDKDIESLITSAMCAIGIPANLKGYSFLRTSINMAINSPDTVHSVTNTLYPAIAKMYNTTPNRVERNIRNAIEIAWSRGDKKILSQLFGTNLVFTNPRPTNTAFIAMIADKLRTKTK